MLRSKEREKTGGHTNFSSIFCVLKARATQLESPEIIRRVCTLLSRLLRSKLSWTAGSGTGSFSLDLNMVHPKPVGYRCRNKRAQIDFIYVLYIALGDVSWSTSAPCIYQEVFWSLCMGVLCKLLFMTIRRLSYCQKYKEGCCKVAH